MLRRIFVNKNAQSVWPEGDGLCGHSRFDCFLFWYGQGVTESDPAPPFNAPFLKKIASCSTVRRYEIKHFQPLKRLFKQKLHEEYGENSNCIKPAFCFDGCRM